MRAAGTSGRAQGGQVPTPCPPSSLGWPPAGYPEAAAAWSPPGASSSPEAGWGCRRAGRSPTSPPRRRRLLPRPAGPVASLLVSFPRPRPLSVSLPPLNSKHLLHLLVSAPKPPPRGGSPGPPGCRPVSRRPSINPGVFCFQVTEWKQRLS